MKFNISITDSHIKIMCINLHSKDKTRVEIYW